MLALAGSDPRMTEFFVHRGVTPVVISPSKASATVVVFVSTLCPISDKYVERLNDLHRQFSPPGVQLIVADPNANESWRDVEKYATANDLVYSLYKDNANQLADRLGAR